MFLIIFRKIVNICSWAVEDSTCIWHSHGKATASLFKQEHPNTIRTKLQITINGKIELVIKRTRWKAFFYEQGSNKFIPENYGLKSLNWPPNIKDMTNFENDLINLPKTIKFHVTNSSFQQQLTEDIKIIKNTKATLTFADKTSNLYKLPKRNSTKS